MASQGEGQGGIGRLYRVGVAVRDLEASVARIGRLFGLTPTLRFTNPLQSVTCAWLQMGECIFELIQSTSPYGNVARFIEKRGEGLYLVAIEVDDLEAASAVIRERGGEIILPAAAPFAPGGRNNFVHPRSVAGVLVELVEPPASGAR